MKNNKLLLLVFFICLSKNISAQDKTLFFISNSHLDTQWNWDIKTTLNEYIPRTMRDNFTLLDKYEKFHFNFEAAIHYMWMKEYYPTEYERLKEYIKEGRWSISGGSINANDVMVPSAESIIRNFLYGQNFFKQEFGRKGGSDIMLPDCFGFPYSLPTLGKHCGVTGFHTAKLAWTSGDNRRNNYDKLAPFGIWKGVDGSEIYAIFKPDKYDEYEKYNKDMSYDSDIFNAIELNESQYGISAAFRYVGPSSDRGGALKDNPNVKGENTPYWLQESVNSDGPVTVKLATPDEVFEYIDAHRNDKYFVWDNELPMSLHGTGCYTSQAIMKYWNRKNELLADATEKSSVLADWLGGMNYPADIIRDSWIRILWHQFHDDLTGTSVPSAYNFSYNDELLVNSNLSTTLTNSVGAIVKYMDTQVDGTPLVVYNPLSITRTDIVEASVILEKEPKQIRVLNIEGNEVLSQVLSYDSERKELIFIFQATVPALGYATYELRLNEESTIDNFASSLLITDNSLENAFYKISLNKNGDVAAIFDKQQEISLLTSAIRLGFFNDVSHTFPSWEINWENVNNGPVAYVDENVEISIVERGPLRISLKVSRTKNNSEFVQYIQLTDERVSERIDFVNEVNWQTREKMLKAIFPLTAESSKATYDLSIGAIEREVNDYFLYEVAGHQWADQTHSNETFGVSILNDCKYGWDKPNNTTLRLTLLHTPEVGGSDYGYQKDQDLGLNKFTYSFYRHLGKWNENTQWEASRLNQPLMAFQAPKHTGQLGKNVEFVNTNTSKVAIKALKKAEESDEIIVRVYELTGENQSNVTLTFPVNIASARELNGIEEEIGSAAYAGNSLSFNIGKFQPKTFAVRLESYPEELLATIPSSTFVDLSYNIDVISSDDNKGNADSGIKYAFPTELLPENDILVADGIEFKIGSRRNGSRNAVYCDGRTIELPSDEKTKKIYILAASVKSEGSFAKFMVDGKDYSFLIPYYSGNMGAWETEYNMGSEFRRDNIAFTATHRHNIKDKVDDYYNFMYMYKYVIPVERNVSTLTLPDDRSIHVYAISLSDNENDDIISASEIISFPVYSDIDPVSRDCINNQLIPISVTASHENGNEVADNANDGDLNTKWCVTNNDTPWLEFRFAEDVEICRWFVMNAGTEGLKYITPAFRLQKYHEGKWVDVDVVKNNTINKVNRSVEPFTTKRVRLQIDKGEQNGTTTRILEFSLYGTTTTSISNDEIEELDFYIKGNYPNPFANTTVIQCIVPQNITELNLGVYDLSGKQVDNRQYAVAANSSIQEIEWENTSLENGMYLYTVSAMDNGKLMYSDTRKMIIAK